MNMYLKSIRIWNIKSIKDLFYEFPNIQFDLDGKPIIKHGVILTGSNFVGKTTFIQCLTTAVGNDIGDSLKPDEALKEGQHEGGFHLQFINTKGELSELKVIFEKDINEPVKKTWQYKAGARTLKSYQSGALRTLRKIFNYHYINPNDIITLSATKPGRRKLMNYFLYSVSDEVRNEYMQWDEAETAAFNLRTERNVERARTKTIRDDAELSPLEVEQLKQLTFLRNDRIRITKERDEIIKAISEYEAIEKKLYPAEDEVYSEHGHHTNMKFRKKSVEDSLLKYNNLISTESEELRKAIKASEGLDHKITTEVRSLTSKLSNAELVDNPIDNYTTILETIKTSYRTLSEIDTDVKSQVTNIQYNINRYTKERDALLKSKEELIAEEQTLLSQLAFEKPTSEGIDLALKQNAEKLEHVSKIKAKEERFNEAVENALNAEMAWQVEDDKVQEARENKARIIKEQNIEVEGFDFTPDGVTLKGHDFAERNISGAERRIAATQFTMAMNSSHDPNVNNLKLAILEEMESLDSQQEQHIMKFAADRGFVVVSDNVTKAVVDEVIIKNVPIV